MVVGRKPRVYSYLRFSTREQQLGDSYRRQNELRKLWLERNGYELDQTLCFEDVGVSSFRGKHAKDGELAVFLEMVQAGQIERGSILLLECLDRFSRER